MLIRGMHQTFQDEEGDGTGAGADGAPSGGEGEPQDTPAANTPEEFATLQAENARLAQRAQLLDDFERNPESVLRDVAGRLGMELTPRQANNEPSAQDSTPPKELVDSISQSLPPEMQFMADALAKATHTANQAALRPFQQQQAQTAEQQRMAERDAIAAEMDSLHPTWKQSLTDMEERYNFLKTAVNGGSMRHPKFGTLQEMLFQLATGSKDAATTAAARMRDAAQNATSQSDNQAPAAVDIQKQIADAKSSDDKFTIAFKAAMAEHGNL